MSQIINEVEIGENNEGIVRWDEFMPRKVLSVLLVEPDYSTCQIITALLRKCNYKVASVADGLQAWDILKKHHSSIDLILMELDLPSISGYALLTLIMEHDGCKNIPVIVTSSQDCVSMVLNCMSKGASDFLVKPVRKNELKNLWRHVWRRLQINDRHGPQNLDTEQLNDKTTFINSSANKRSSGDNGSTSRKRSKCSNNGSASVALKNEDDGGSFTSIAIKYESEPCREAMDLIGIMENSECIVAQASSNGELSKNNSTPELNLSLKRSFDSENKEVDERQAINYSNVSAFSWYNSNKKSQASSPLLITEMTDIKEVTDSFPRSKTFNNFRDDKHTEITTTPQPMPSSLMGPSPVSSAKSTISTFHREDSSFITSPSHGYSSSQVVDRSDSSTPCNEFAGQSSGFGSVSDITAVNTYSPGMVRRSSLEKVVKVESCDNIIELDNLGHKTGHHSAEREAALARFRLKRKGRCFEKKVRYQSRKKQAEQRPRVKGQFVRQV